MVSHLTWNFAHCVYILSSSSCLYKIYIFNMVFTEICLLIYAFKGVTSRENNQFLNCKRSRSRKALRPSGILHHLATASQRAGLLFWFLQISLVEIENYVISLHVTSYSPTLLMSFLAIVAESSTIPSMHLTPALKLHMSHDVRVHDL